MGKDRLTPPEREFLQRVADAAFANPFSEERQALDCRIAEMAPHADHEAVLDAALARIRAFLDAFRRRHGGDIAGFAAEDRPLLRYVRFFEVFHRYKDAFDTLIRRQIEADDAPCPVPFAEEALRELAESGLTGDEPARHLALFYQMRRAFYFIENSLVGRSASMRQLRLALWNNVFTHDIRLYDRYLWNRMEDFSTLLLGETGTGKGAAAAAIGRSGYIPYDAANRRFAESFMRSFLSINLSQFPESLIESELFGHRKGAFTGAVEAHEGVLARCSPHGAIFLDEIGDVSVPVQIKLLQVLQDRRFSPVGSHAACRFRGRVIAATNKPLDVLRRQSAFRDDFFYRLCSDVIVVPPLRERIRETPAELDDLIALTVRRIAGQDAPELADAVRTAIGRDLGAAYAWPGNVRELEQCVRRVLLNRRYAGDTRPAPSDPGSRLLEGIAAGDYTAAGLLDDYCAMLHERHGNIERVAKITDLDRRTARKHIRNGLGERSAGGTARDAAGDSASGA
jgi:DNA-binding NtrC family response regulator